METAKLVQCMLACLLAHGVCTLTPHIKLAGFHLHLDSVHTRTSAGRRDRLLPVIPNAAVSAEPPAADATMDALPMLMMVANSVASTPCTRPRCAESRG